MGTYHGNFDFNIDNRGSYAITTTIRGLTTCPPPCFGFVRCLLSDPQSQSNLVVAPRNSRTIPLRTILFTDQRGCRYLGTLYCVLGARWRQLPRQLRFQHRGSYGIPRLQLLQRQRLQRTTTPTTTTTSTTTTPTSTTPTSTSTSTTTSTTTITHCDSVYADPIASALRPWGRRASIGRLPDSIFI